MKKWKHVSPKKLSARKRGVFISKSVAVVGGSVEECEHVGFKTFTEKSFERFREFVCGICKHLVFRREQNTWICDKGYSLTKEFCVSWVDDVENIRIKMSDGTLMYLGYEDEVEVEVEDEDEDEDE